MDKQAFLLELLNIGQEASQALAEVKDLTALEAVRVRFLGSKGRLSEISKKMGALSKEDRPEAGSALNQLKNTLNSLYQEALLKEKSESELRDTIDVSLPGRKRRLGAKHLIPRTTEEICQIFARLGFSIAEGPEVETDYYNFEALNFPSDHPSRDMQQSLFVGSGLLLRTHTSGMQIRTMERQKPPIWIVVPGKTYRRDDDLTHSPMFNQIEGLVVDKHITMADLKGVLQVFAKEFFEGATKIRLRPSFFPFTEPSAEVDVSCVSCHGKGCRLCKGTGWLEVLGCGMVNPALYKNVGYDPSLVTGFAFGIGVDRMAMLKYNLDNIGRFYSGDTRFLRQFP
ncbi:MAG: phenylalanine--tRNA ligase subunit alpha [Deltaproteobacteria bacterium]|jgi:phenylalanyl-tRNA synthetase alpha chain|nr:phenylalanine--tRNA ligase subunit alpha [Deltaproteobacteria bacterium]